MPKPGNVTWQSLVCAPIEPEAVSGEQFPNPRYGAYAGTHKEGLQTCGGRHKSTASAPLAGRL